MSMRVHDIYPAFSTRYKHAKLPRQTYTEEVELLLNDIFLSIRMCPLYHNIFLPYTMSPQTSGIFTYTEPAEFVRTYTRREAAASTASL